MIITLGSLSPTPTTPPPPTPTSRHKPSRPSRESKLRQITAHGSLRQIQQGQSGRNRPSSAIKANHKEPINIHYCKWWVMLNLPFVFFPFVQFATNIKMVCDNWNISTALWLRRLENFNSFMSGKSPLYSTLGNIFVLFQNCIWTMFSAQDPSGVYYVICLAWILSGILYDVFVACTIHRGGKNGKYILACEQALHLGESREFTRQPHSKGDARLEFAGRLRVLSWPVSKVAVKKTIGYDRCFFFCFPPSPSIYFFFFLTISCCAGIFPVCRTPKNCV